MEEYLCSQSVFLFVLRQEITKGWEERWSRDERETIQPTEMINAAERSSFLKICNNGWPMHILVEKTFV